MEWKNIYATVAVLLLALEVQSDEFSLSATYVHDRTRCTGDRYMKIDTAKCTHIADKSQCEARCDGDSSSSRLTKFKLKKMTGGKVCIKSTQKLGDIHYVLKVNKTKPVQLVFESKRCDRQDDSSLFVRTHVRDAHGGFFIFNHAVDNEVMCLTRHCNGTLSLTHPSSNFDRRCYFERHVHN